MRYPPEHKQAVRERIVAAAARVLRRDGLLGVSIPEMMKAAGLTHGGFYAHFADRDSLVAAAVERAAEETGERVFSASADLDTTLSAYLSMLHVEHPESGCVIAALGTDGARQGPTVRAAFANAVKGLLTLIERKRGGERPSDETLLLASQMVGAVVLARLVDDRDLAERILSAAKSPHSR